MPARLEMAQIHEKEALLMQKCLGARLILISDTDLKILPPLLKLFKEGDIDRFFVLQDLRLYLQEPLQKAELFAALEKRVHHLFGKSA